MRGSGGDVLTIVAPLATRPGEPYLVQLVLCNVM